MLNRIIILLVMLIIISCDLPQDPGPMPTEIIAQKFEPGHNVFGVLRNDGQPGTSFLHVERAWETEEMTEEFDAFIRNATVTIFNDSAEWDFTYLNDTVYNEIYTNPGFLPLSGMEYGLIVESPELPTLTGTVVIPEKPPVDSSSIKIVNNYIQFSLAATSSIRMYDIYVFSELDVIDQRLISNGDAMEVKMDFSELGGVPNLIFIYGYESNLATYQTSPSTIKPQTYHETVITVEGGYGCFGALSVISIALD
ncbi:MAG: DUF4249 family protein [Candidatus Marinimicrobia bacterium]|nr:DUF4249 family protein [Candidatus Neomarinimicrobiota bacterium]